MPVNIKHLHIPIGSQIILEGSDGDDLGYGVLMENLDVELNSEFESISDFASMKSNVGTAITALGALSRDIFGVGFSSQFKQMGYQFWKTTKPLSVKVTLEFAALYNAKLEVSDPILKLCKLPLPREGGLLGSLIPPGPSIRYALGDPKEGGVMGAISGFLFGEEKEETEKADFDENSKSSYFNIYCAGYVFSKCICKSAVPSFGKRVDGSGYSVYGKIDMAFETIYSATQELIKSLSPP